MKIEDAKSRIKRILPKPIKRVLRNRVDEVELLFRRGVDELTPPQSLVAAVGGDFEEAGQEFFKYFLELDYLKPNDAVLDVGSGCGRMAVPLTRYLDQEGSYEGFDIEPTGINWCKRKITLKYPNFQFQRADIYHELSNPRGKYKAGAYRFPYPDKSFDFVFLTSVFTHLLPQEAEHYLAEIVRVSKDNGRVFTTFFLLNNESTPLIDEGRGIYDFEYTVDGYRTIDPVHHDAAVAYPEDFIRHQFQKQGLKIMEPVHYGSWCGRQNFLSLQDIVVATLSD